MTSEHMNRDDRTIRGFGQEWSAFDQSKLRGDEYRAIFDGYFGIFPFEALPASASGFDLGCGSGRWAVGVAPRVAKLHCIDPSPAALQVARKNLANVENVEFHIAGVEDIPLPDDSQDFGYALGVLHHVPDIRSALKSCVRKLKRGAPLLVYVYYRFDNRPGWFRWPWLLSEGFRWLIARAPFRIRKMSTDLIAATIYLPLSRFAALLERLGKDPSGLPLSAYRNRSFYTMRTDALDRFGTRLEQRFTRVEIEEMMEAAGLANIVFSETEPFWVACGSRA